MSATGARVGLMVLALCFAGWVFVEAARGMRAARETRQALENQ